MARILGLDVGRSSVRGVLLRSALRSVEHERFIEIPLSHPPDSPARTPELKEAIESLLKALPASPNATNAAVPGEHVSFRRVELPIAARKRLAEVLPFELEASLPYDLDDAVIDHQLIDASGHTLAILATAVLRDRVRDMLDDLRDIGVAPRELAAGAAALDGLCVLLPELRTEEPILLLDWADDRTDLCFLQHGRCVMARTLEIGVSAMPDASSDLEKGIARTLAAFRASGQNPPARVYLSGSGIRAEGAIEWLSSIVGQDVQPLPLHSGTGESRPDNAVFGKAAALAARTLSGAHRIDLRTGEFAPTDLGKGLAEHANLIVTCAVVIVVSIMFSLKAEQALLVDEQAALRGQLAAVTQKVFGEQITNVDQAELRVRNPRSSDPLPRFDAYDALAAFSASVPEEITHEVRRLTIDGSDDKREGSLEIQGSLESIAQRDRLVSELEAHPCFREIERGKTAPDRRSDRIRYTLEAVVQCPGEGEEDLEAAEGGST